MSYRYRKSCALAVFFKLDSDCPENMEKIAVLV